MVDNDPLGLRYIRDVLTREGYSPMVVSDPDDMPRLMEKERPQMGFRLRIGDVLFSPPATNALGGAFVAVRRRGE